MQLPGASSSWQGDAGRGKVWSGEAWHGSLGDIRDVGEASKQGANPWRLITHHGAVGPCRAPRGKAGPGLAGQGMGCTAA